MKFQLLLFAVLGFVAVSSKKDNCGNGRCNARVGQIAKINNCANSNSCGTAIDGAYFGGATIIGLAANYLGQYENQGHC